MKTCSKCHIEKPVGDFYRRSKGGVLMGQCKACVRERQRLRMALLDESGRERLRANQRRYVAKDPEGYERRHRDWQYRRNFGIDLDLYEELLEKQMGLCATCLNPPSSGRLVVDHDHETRLVRGLLCQQCNAALGMVKEDRDTLRRLGLYLLYYQQVLPEIEMSDVIVKNGR